MLGIKMLTPVGQGINLMSPLYTGHEACKQGKTSAEVQNKGVLLCPS